MGKRQTGPDAIGDEALDGVVGGVAPLPPAVQKLHQPAADPGDGSVDANATGIRPFNGIVDRFAQGARGSGT